ncbi:dihydroneopterin aldolase [Fulvivirga sp. M361]|uniref:dihydroneopterin aldolase n=1 Tax=Fulvivirga sp. M361 TaxID=2594266 RepID=UPI00117ADCCC|nr:dihydroneopterin aldolase [Fulvivirga sp. M361]TRX53798.1 dihydroneopterin aldolase [Fulvivirga sp. M361]
MGKICLKGLKFKAYHGYYDEERQLGNTFEVKLTVITDFYKAAVNDDLNETVDYEKLYAIVQEEMAIPAKLLEHVVQKIADRVINECKAVTKVKVKLSKFNPPIGGECHSSVVSLTQHR